MRFTSDKTSFGRHETFALRYGWLTKGAQALMSGDPVFEAEDATVQLGVGKNMVASIRHWLQAARLIEKSDGAWLLTDIGAYLFDDDGLDPYLEDEATLWLVHWLIASNPGIATTWWWFFSRFHKPEFTIAEMVDALQGFVRDGVPGRHASSSLKSDAAVLLRMYVRTSDGARLPPEEVLDSPLSLLGLITHVSGSKTYESRPGRRGSLPPAILGFSVVELLTALGERQMPIEDLMYGRSDYPAIGAVFRLTEARLLAKLEILVAEMPEMFGLRETAGIHQFYLLREIKPLALLETYYEDMGLEDAA